MYLPTKYTLITNRKEHLLVGKIGKWSKWTRGGLGGASWNHGLLDRVSEKDTVTTPMSSYGDILTNYVSVAQACPILWDPMDCSPQGSSVHEILQARILEWVAIPFSRGSSRPRDWTQVSCIAGRFFTTWTTKPRKPNCAAANYKEISDKPNLKDI